MSINMNQVRGTNILRRHFAEVGIEATDEMLKEALKQTVPVAAVVENEADRLAHIIVQNNRRLMTEGICVGILIGVGGMAIGCAVTYIDDVLKHRQR